MGSQSHCLEPIGISYGGTFRMATWDSATYRNGMRTTITLTLTTMNRKREELMIEILMEIEKNTEKTADWGEALYQIAEENQKEAIRRDQ